jgi:8-oxo-dGTP pyrophosphatase MutT (NUDIX family)
MRLTEYVKKTITSAVLFTDGDMFLSVKPTGISYWEIPKGENDEDETPFEAAVREFKEETNFSLNRDDLHLVGYFPFHKTKDLYLFSYIVDRLPSINRFKCMSYTTHYGPSLPEIDKFEYMKLFDYTDLRQEFHKPMKKAIEKVLKK